MKPFEISSVSRVKGTVCLLGDKSIAHRAALLSALCPRSVKLKNFPANKDCLASLTVLKSLGIRILRKRQGRFTYELTIFGNGLRGLKKPSHPLYVGESGTTLRIFLGVLAGHQFRVTLRAAQSLTRRPMRRVADPLRRMGAKIVCASKNKTHNKEEYPPITIEGGRLHPIIYTIPVASAQVKTALLLAGLYARGTSKIAEPIKTRDHTERLLRMCKVAVKEENRTLIIRNTNEVRFPPHFTIPGDISSASFFLALAALRKGSSLTIKNVSLNPSRLGMLNLLRNIGVSLVIKYKIADKKDREPMGDVIVTSAALRAFTVKKALVPLLIDELPVLMVIASLSQGKSVFYGIQELRLKETDRIRSMCENLKKLGAQVKIIRGFKEERIEIEGKPSLQGASVKSFGDHRTAMSMIIAGLCASGKTRIDDISCIDKSFPGFIQILRTLLKHK